MDNSVPGCNSFVASAEGTASILESLFLSPTFLLGVVASA